MWIFFSLILAGVLWAVHWLYKRYPAKRVPRAVLLVSAFAWLTSISIIALVPVDVWTTLEGRGNEPVAVMWRISYWSTQILTWLAIPLFQGYVDAGDFSFLGRLRTSLMDNLMFYVAVGVLGCIGLLILVLAGNLTYAALPGFCIALSNTFGLVVVVLLLGYGLVSIPKYVWSRSVPETRLRWCSYKVGVLAAKLEDAVAELDRVCLVVQATKRQISRRDPLRPYIDIIDEEAKMVVPRELVQARTIGDEFDELSAEDLEYGTDIKRLANLRRRVSHAIAGFEAAKAQYIRRIARAFELSDICIRRTSGEYTGRDDIVPLRWYEKVFWYHRCVIKPILRRVFALGLAALSATVVWSEVTIALRRNPDLSPFSILIRAAKKEWPVCLVVLMPLVYMCLCTYHSLFSLGAFRFYHLIPGATSSNSLLINAGLMCRFAPPMAFNFLHIIRMNEEHNGRLTVFSKEMGAMEVMPFLGTNLNIWLPVFLLVNCILILFKVWHRAVMLIIPAHLRFDSEDADDECSERGKQLIRKEQEAVQAGRPIGTSMGIEESDWLEKGGNGQPSGLTKVRSLGTTLINNRVGGGSPHAHPLGRDRSQVDRLDAIFTDITGGPKHKPLKGESSKRWQFGRNANPGKKLQQQEKGR